MSPTTQAVRARRRARFRAAVAAVAVLAVTGPLAACSADDGGTAPRPDTTPDAAVTRTPAAATPGPTPTTVPLPDVPVRSADLASATTTPQRPAPTRLRVDALGIDLPLDAVGVAADGQMEIPPMAERGGWYRFGATPGDAAGTVVVAAHVDSVVSAGLGPFAALRDAQPGQTAVVDLADGTQVTYTVASVAKQPKPEVAWSDVFDRDGPPRLVLITCGGTWRSEVRSYSDNVLVTAAPAGG